MRLVRDLSWCASSFAPCEHLSRAQMSTKFDMRGDENVIRNYGRMLVELAAAIPDGIVCFFVSYSYMDSIVSRWNDMGILKAWPC